MTTYWVISMTRNGREQSTLATLFATPFQAECFMRHLPIGNLGYTRGVRPATWREREQGMFANGIYERPVWHEERWWMDCMHQFHDHFVHISLADPSGIAFTEDDIKGEADRQTSMRPGKWLQKFLGAGPNGLIEHGPLKGTEARITKMQIAYYATWHQAGKRPLSEDVLAFAEDEGEMVRVYEDGPDSCMMGKGWAYENHPIRVYAGGGLALAYLTSVSGEVIARALCWPSKEVFGRVYPTPNTGERQNNYDELMARLKAMGWKSINEDNNVFEGALLQQITNRYGSYMMPYLDHEYGVEETYHNGKSWWRMSRSEDHQDGVDGVLSGANVDWTCESCEEGFSDNYDSYTVYSYFHPSTVAGRRNGGYPRGDAQWCESCRDNGTFWCEGSEEHYVDSADSVYAADGCTYERHWFEAQGGWQCSYSDEYYLKNDAEPVVLDDGSLIHEDYLAEAAFQCRVTQKWWPKPYESLAVPGCHHEFDDDAEHPVEWACVLPAMPEDPGDVEAWARGLTAHVVPAPQADLFIAEPVVVIDLAKSGLHYDAACINPAVRPLLHASFTS